MRIGYARVSTDDQTLDLQRDAMKRAKCRQVYEEHASGKNTARPQLEACLKSLREGDTLIVWRLDRLGRSLGPHSPNPRVQGARHWVCLAHRADRHAIAGRATGISRLWGARRVRAQSDPRAHARRPEGCPGPRPQGWPAPKA